MNDWCCRLKIFFLMCQCVCNNGCNNQKILNELICWRAKFQKSWTTKSSLQSVAHRFWRESQDNFAQFAFEHLVECCLKLSLTRLATSACTIFSPVKCFALNWCFRPQVLWLPERTLLQKMQRAVLATVNVSFTGEAESSTTYCYVGPSLYLAELSCLPPLCYKVSRHKKKWLKGTVKSNYGLIFFLWLISKNIDSPNSINNYELHYIIRSNLH